MLIGLKQQDHEDVARRAERVAPKKNSFTGQEAEQASQFLFYEQAKFQHPNEPAKIERFETLALAVIPKLEASAGAKLVATGLSKQGVWAIWDFDAVAQLWEAMTITGTDPGYAEMQDLIIGESQNFCHVTDRFASATKPEKNYYYDVLTKPAGAASLQGTLLDLETAPHEENWTSSVILSSITGSLYQVTRFWRCNGQPKTSDTGATAWPHAKYEPKA